LRSSYGLSYKGSDPLTDILKVSAVDNTVAADGPKYIVAQLLEDSSLGAAADLMAHALQIDIKPFTSAYSV